MKNDNSDLKMAAKRSENYMIVSFGFKKFIDKTTKRSPRRSFLGTFSEKVLCRDFSGKNIQKNHQKMQFFATKSKKFT